MASNEPLSKMNLTQEAAEESKSISQRTSEGGKDEEKLTDQVLVTDAQSEKGLKVAEVAQSRDSKSLPISTQGQFVGKEESQIIPTGQGTASVHTETVTIATLAEQVSIAAASQTQAAATITLTTTLPQILPTGAETASVRTETMTIATVAEQVTITATSQTQVVAAAAPTTAPPQSKYERTLWIAEGKQGGVVYKANVKDPKAVVAIKVMPTSNPGNVDAHPEYPTIRQLEAEIRFHKIGDTSPYFVDLYEHFHVDQTLWIITEYCEGGSIKKLMRNLDVQLNEECIRDVVASVAQALEVLHNSRIIHRDIKADNVFVTGQGVVKLADFGVSVELTEDVPRRRSLMGTPNWMAPEVIREGSYDETADLWSLGITMIEMAQGEPPLMRLPIMKIVFAIPRNPPPTLDNADDWSRAMRSFLATCLQKDPSDRDTVSDLLEHDFIKDACVRLNAAAPIGQSASLAELVQSRLQEIESHYRPVQLDS